MNRILLIGILFFLTEFSYAQPSNDDCANAIALTVNTDLDCGTVTAGTLASATASGVNETECSGTENDDTWYSFIATATTHVVEITNIVSGGTTDMYHSVWSGTCAGLSDLTCSDGNTSTTSGLTIGDTYLVRVNSWGSGTYTTTFDVCVGTPPPPPANDNCSSSTSLGTVPSDGMCLTGSGTTASAGNSGFVPSCDFAGGDYDVFYSFVAPTGGTVLVSRTLGTAGALEMVVLDACAGTEIGNCGTSLSVSGLTAGNTYILMVWTDDFSTGGTFDLCLKTPPPAPANDDCANAVSLTVNTDLDCGTVTAGSLASATASGVNETECSGTENDDTWYSFIATATTHVVEITNIVSGGTTDMYHSVWSGTCAGLSDLTCSDGNTSTTSGLTIGDTYLVRVNSWGSGTYTTTFDVCVGTPPPPPANDDCSGKIAFPFTVKESGECSGTPYSLDLSTATDDIGNDNPSCDAFSPNVGLWYTWTATSTGVVYDSGTGSPGMAIYENGTCGSLSEVDCLNNIDGSISGLVVGNVYIIYIWSDATTPGTVTFCIEETPPPPGCGDTFVDSGGDSGDYSANEDQDYLICPDNMGDVVTVTFTAFNTESGWDYLTVYNGDDDSAPALHTGSGFSGTTIPGPFTSTATSGCLFFNFDSDGSGQRAGWEADITCAIPPPAHNICSTALQLTDGGQVTESGLSFAGATSSMGAESCDGDTAPASTDQNDVWFKINTDGDGGMLDITVTGGTGSDVVIALYAADCTTLLSMTCSDNSGNAGAETISYADPAFTSKGGSASRSETDYLLRVYEKTASGSTFSVEMAGTALPIEIVSFNGEATKYGNVLRWSTSSEINNDYQAIERSIDGKSDWQEVGRHHSKGSATKEGHYQLTDEQPYSTTYYRINSRDLDGRNQLSDVISVSRNNEIKTLSLYPNPSSENFTIESESNRDGYLEVAIFDISGKKVMSVKYPVTNGVNYTNVNIDDMAQGVYMINVSSDSENRVIKFVKE